MGKRTGIAWADSTRNFWSGCTKVGPGCDGCYAEAFNRWTRGKNLETGEAKNWGPGAQRVSHIKGAVADLKQWNKEAEADGKRRSVFVNTFSDTFDNAVDDDWRNIVWLTIDNCPWIDFFLVTKRIGNVPKMVPAGWMQKGFPSNVRLMITVVNQEEADRDVPKLLKLPCKNGISYEPAIGPVDWRAHLQGYCPEHDFESGFCVQRDHPGVRHLDWIIVGGESKQAGHPARPFVIGWARDTVSQCRAAGVAVFVKQLGSNATNREGVGHPFKDPAGEDPDEWPEDLRVREFPR